MDHFEESAFGRWYRYLILAYRLSPEVRAEQMRRIRRRVLEARAACPSPDGGPKIEWNPEEVKP